MIGRVIALLTIPLTLWGFWGIARLQRKPQRLTGSALIIPVVMGCLTLGINLLFLNRAAPGCAGVALLLVGGALGLLSGRTTKVEIVGDMAVGRRSALYLVFWALSYAITQLLSTLGSTWLTGGGLAAMFFSTGMTLGAQLGLWRRQSIERRRVAA